jgi:hypothetical protein
MSVRQDRRSGRLRLTVRRTWKVLGAALVALLCAGSVAAQPAPSVLQAPYWYVDDGTDSFLDIANGASAPRLVVPKLLLGGQTPLTLPHVVVPAGGTVRIPLQGAVAPYLSLAAQEGAVWGDGTKARSRWGTALLKGEDLSGVSATATVEDATGSMSSPFRTVGEAFANLESVWERPTEDTEVFFSLYNPTAGDVTVATYHHLAGQVVAGGSLTIPKRKAVLVRLRDLVPAGTTLPEVGLARFEIQGGTAALLSAAFSYDEPAGIWAAVTVTPPDTLAPGLAIAAPESLVAGDGTPDVVVQYSDAGSGADPLSLRVRLDGVDITASCAAGPSSATCATTLVSVGDHTVEAEVRDRRGNLGTAQAAFFQRFTVEHAYASAVTFKISDLQPDLTLGLDAAEQVVWSSGPSGTWGYRRDTDGTVIEEVDPAGNLNMPNADTGGRPVEQYHEYNFAGSWWERFLYDAGGSAVLEAVDSGVNGVDSKLAVLGLAPGVTPAAPSVQQTSDAAGTTTVISGPFATVTHWESAAPETLPDDVAYIREKTEALGRSMTVWKEMSTAGIVVEDDWGGSQLRTFDTSDRLVSVEDADSPVVAIERDAAGRPANVYVGQVSLLRYTYDAGGRWISKELIDRRTNEVVYRLNSAIPPGSGYQPPQESEFQPRKVTRARLGGYEVVEWDAIYPWDGHVLATLEGHPYALIPLDGAAPVWRSVTPLESEGLPERFDYSADQIIVHLATDEGGPNSLSQTAALILPRYNAAVSETQAALTKSGRINAISEKGISISFCNGGCLCISRPTRYGEDLTIDCRDPSSNGPGWGPRGNGGGRNPGGGGPGGGGGGSPRGPRGRTPIGPNKLRAVNEGKAKANTALKNQKCADLFKNYSGRLSDGAYVLNNMSLWEGQVQPNRDGEIVCNRPSQPAAWYDYGSGTMDVYLCDPFGSLNGNLAAIKLIHEALHVAGLPEDGTGTNAQTPSQIDAMVKKNCGL